MEKSEVLRHLKLHIQEKLNGGLESGKGIDKILSSLQNASVEDISFGDQPSYFYAYMKCNSTGVGISSFEGSKTQRTVAMDYTTDEYLFIDGHEGAAVKGLELFHLKQGETVNYYKKSQIETVADSYGTRLHLQQFRDLNFTIDSHRINRYTTNITKGPFSYPIRPIFVSVMDIERPVFVGYVYEKGGKEYIIIELKDISKAGKSGTVFSPWMLLSLIFPPVLIVSIFVIISRIKKNRE